MTGPFLSSVPTSTVAPLAFPSAIAGAWSPTFQHGATDNAASQLVDMTLHDRLPIGRNALVPAGSVFGELLP